MAKGEMPDWLFGILHPVKALRVKSRQTGVAMEHMGPPAGQTIEEFPNLPLSTAAKSMGLIKEKQENRGGVRLEDWSQSDQERLKKGLKPLGHPEHPNV